MINRIKAIVEWILSKLYWLEDNGKVVIDFIIKFAFYILIIIAILSCTYYLTSEFINVNSRTQQPLINRNATQGDALHTQYISPLSPDSNQLALSNTVNPNYSDGEELSGKILKIAEHVFLYLLPCFTLLGFFTYYKERSSYQLRGITSGPRNNENASMEMVAAKTLFISSLISYVLIKVVEEISEKHCDTDKLIAFGILLVMLFFYYYFLDSHNSANQAVENKKNGDS